MIPQLQNSGFAYRVIPSVNLKINLQNEKQAELRDIHVLFYTYSEIYKKVAIWDIEYSVRGKQNELWTKEEILLRINYFLKGLIQRI